MKLKLLKNKEYDFLYAILVMICILGIMSFTFNFNFSYKNQIQYYKLLSFFTKQLKFKKNQIQFGKIGNNESLPKLSNIELLPKICILVPVSSRGLSWQSTNDTFIKNRFLHSLYKTGEFGNYSYVVYMGYDIGDTFFDSNVTLENFQSEFDLLNAQHMVDVHFRTVSMINEKKKPGPIMNKLSLTAYQDGCDFMYRINDDTELLTPWTSLFVNTLKTFNPPFIGVVGPTCHEGNTDILTHDFVHKSHVALFGYHYPHELTDWWLDDWITKVYGTSNTLKLDTVTVKHHTMVTRYEVSWDSGAHLQPLLEKGAEKIEKFKTPVRLVSYSLYGNDPRYLDGAIENSKLIKEVYPGWTMRVYYDKSLPQTMIDFLRNQKVELVDMSESPIKNEMSWRFLPAAESNIERFVSRDIDSRLSKREALAVQEWIDSGKTFHILKDHPSHSGYSISGGMWGALGGSLIDIEKWIVEDALSQDYMYDMIFLDKHVWPTMQRVGVMVHDSFSCDKENTKPFPVERNGTEHVGSVYLDGQVRSGDAAILLEALSKGMPNC